MTDVKTKPYRELAKEYHRYFGNYGGVQAVLISPYFHASIIFLAFSTLSGSNGELAQYTLDFIPSLLGFTLAGYAIFISFGDDEFRAAIAGKVDGKTSPLITFSTTFLHFILVQCLSFIIALIAIFARKDSVLYRVEEMFQVDVPAAFFKLSYIIAEVVFATTTALLLYSVFLVPAAAMAVFRMVSAFDRSNDRPPQSTSPPNQSPPSPSHPHSNKSPPPAP